MRNTLVANHISYCRNNRNIFSDISFSLPPGEALHIRGSNGSGKTSLLKVILGITSPTSGEILWNGTKINEIRDEYAQRVVYTGHRFAIKNELTVKENIFFSLQNKGIPFNRLEIEDALIELDLRRHLDVPAYQLSEGQKRRLCLLKLWSTPSSLWVLDEPFNNLDKRSTEILSELLLKHLKHGQVVFTSHQTPTKKLKKLIEISLS